jgi:hypothetical protein
MAIRRKNLAPVHDARLYKIEQSTAGRGRGEKRNSNRGIISEVGQFRLPVLKYANREAFSGTGPVPAPFELSGPF